MKAEEASYLAGFLDGDGSIHFQLVKQRGYRFVYYLRQLSGGGYLRDRGTGMSDLVITSRPLLSTILREVEPYVVFKREHVRRALWLLPQLDSLRDAQEFLRVAREVDAFATLNCSKTKRISAADVERHLRSMGVSVPVTTSSVLLDRGDGSPASDTDPRQIYESHNTPAPRNRVEV